MLRRDFLSLCGLVAGSLRQALANTFHSVRRGGLLPT